MQELNQQKIFWHSRRGMLELDLLLVPFSTDVFPQLSHLDQILYRDFLSEEDQDIFAWLMRRQEPSEERFNRIIDKILAHSVNDN
ncbi:MAG TPA: succinate dehydrogenase assembly factor 2 family protein [Porticoccaceae bacterium]|jgi:antitoxin CptB|nr:succinate dehydrogenase assembly factor 2 family protein [Gammaproteobacteria bacterium]HIL60527.1 succinate dehydrogenase assembly factor 2 family protein [Porticoccaceae bacterium]